MNVTDSRPRTVWGQVSVCFATGFGLGFVRWAPGTLGALAGLPVAIGLSQFVPLAQLLVLGALYWVGIPLCTAAARCLEKKDPCEVIWDEIVTVPLSFLLIEPRLMFRVEILLLGFLLHRLFDIWKPWPLWKLERLPDGLGIMSDDVVAGLYACAGLHLLLWWIPWLSRL